MHSRRNFLAFWGASVALLAVPWHPAGAEESPPAAPGQTSLPLAVDLAADGGRTGAQGIPVLILFSLPGCPYCEALRRSFLTPMLAEPQPRAVLRQVDIDSSVILKDFQGRKLSHQDFATREGIALTPVVGFYGPDGEAVADRLVGAMLPDFYGSYLDDALAKAAAKIRTETEGKGGQKPSRR
ncbi:MAG TPA: thioredoxin fold domain-containing protein [Usitatibacteraceae bacterium]